MSKFGKVCKKILLFICGFGIALGIMLVGINTIGQSKSKSETTNISLPTQKPVCKTLAIPAIKLKVNVKSKLTDANMKKNICQVNQKDYPGMKHNLVLAGHNYLNKTLFSDLDQVKYGEKIIINNYYVYQIDNIQIVKATHQFHPGNKARITLYTCLRENNPKYRLIVEGHLVKKGDNKYEA